MVFEHFLVEKGALYESVIADLKQAVLDGGSENDTIAGIRVYESLLAKAGKYTEAAELRDAVNDWHNGTIKTI